MKGFGEALFFVLFFFYLGNVFDRSRNREEGKERSQMSEREGFFLIQRGRESGVWRVEQYQERVNRRFFLFLINIIKAVT